MNSFDFQDHVCFHLLMFGYCFMLIDLEIMIFYRYLNLNDYLLNHGMIHLLKEDLHSLIRLMHLMDGVFYGLFLELLFPRHLFAFDPTYQIFNLMV